MQQRLLAALQTEDEMDVRLNEKKAELVELERLVVEERRLLEETERRRKEEEHRLEELGANAYEPRLVDPQAVRRKTLILTFDGLLVSIRTTATGLSEFLQACLREFHLMIWASLPKAFIDSILRFLFTLGKISFDLAHHKVFDGSIHCVMTFGLVIMFNSNVMGLIWFQDCSVWSRDECMTFGRKTSRPVYYKDFDMLYEHNICARDVLIVEDEVAKISTNNVMNALVQRRCDLLVETPSSSFLMDHLLPFLTTWRSSVKGIVDFVEETRPWDTLLWAEEPIEALMK
ncbi:hypothetical protein R1sor_003915 [Riccia sorocarpa]|uniref:FCP1 homology domain-containing protein n=1 Tax=Riccia sorocarpa TaxID=122646 RepID=A0ABD3H317_9MARC